MTRRKKETRFVLCIESRGFPASLETRKIYQWIPDEGFEQKGLLRVIDESGEDYLYPSKFFVPIEVPPTATRIFAGVSA